MVTKIHNHMPTFISLIRGINVGGHKRVPMDQLRALCETLGFTQVRTYIQSGNVVFSAGKITSAAVSKKIEEAIVAEFGFPASVISRTPEELATAIGANPFLKESQAEPGKVYIAFLSQSPKPDAARKLEIWATRDERLHCGRLEVYLYYRNGMGQAKLSGAVLEKVLGVTATARNWNTVNQLHRMAAEGVARSS